MGLRNLFPAFALGLALSLFPVSGQAADRLGLRLEGKNIIVPSQDMLKSLGELVMIENTGAAPLPARIAVFASDADGKETLRLSEELKIAPGRSPLPQGFLREVTGLLPFQAGAGVRVAGQTLSGPVKAEGDSLGAALRSELKMGGRTAGGAMVILMDGTDMVTEGIIMIGE